MEKLIERFKKKIKDEDRNYRWFLSKYLPDVQYSNFTTQINLFNPMNDKIKKAIEKYLKEAD